MKWIVFNGIYPPQLTGWSAFLFLEAMTLCVEFAVSLTILYIAAGKDLKFTFREVLWAIVIANICSAVIGVCVWNYLGW